MKPQELRIGNYVAYENQVCEVRSICYMGCGLWCISDKDLTYANFDEKNDFLPIPLTEQRLKDFGFEFSKESVFTFASKDGLDIEWYGEFGKVVWDEIEVDLKYVHQLQNLYFALTGKELMAPLNKEQQKHIKAIREMTKEITESKQKAIKYLKDSGISDFVEKATKSAKANGKTYR